MNNSQAVKPEKLFLCLCHSRVSIKIYTIGHIRRINRKWFNNSFQNVKSFIKLFYQTTIQEREHYQPPHLKPHIPALSVLHAKDKTFKIKKT